jgi:peroxiredoxin-like protein
MAKDTYHYEARTKWTKGKRMRLMVKGKFDMEVSTPPEFGGPDGFLAPGELFVASACACYMTAFFAVAEGAKLHYEDFTCRAKGTVEELEGKGFQFTKIDLYPELTIGDDEEKEWAERVLEMSKKNCLVTNSMTCDVTVNPAIRLKQK